MRKNKMYQPPVLKVVAFKVEGGFAGSGRDYLHQNGSISNGLINFGGDFPTGGVTHDQNNHSGLGQYGYESSLFGSSNQQ